MLASLLPLAKLSYNGFLKAMGIADYSREKYSLHFLKDTP